MTALSKWWINGRWKVKGVAKKVHKETIVKSSSAQLSSAQPSPAQLSQAQHSSKLHSEPFPPPSKRPESHPPVQSSLVLTNTNTKREGKKKRNASLAQ